MSIAVLREMFDQMVVKKDAANEVAGRVWETTWPSWNELPAFETY